MKKQRLMEKQDRPTRKAVAPNRGAAAFSISTAFRPIPGGAPFPAISRHRQVECAAIHNLLAEIHYFRPGLADGPIAIVVLTEGQENALEKFREVAV